jgi:hypothetical protein
MSPPNRTDVRFQDKIGDGLKLNATLAATAASLPHLAIATAFSSALALKLVQMLLNVAHRSEGQRRQKKAPCSFALLMTTCPVTWHCCYSKELLQQKAC